MPNDPTPPPKSDHEIKGLQLWLSADETAWQPPGDFQFTVEVRNSTDQPLEVPIGLCSQIQWPAYVAFYFQEPSGRISRFFAGSDIDIKSLHPHHPWVVEPKAVVRQKFHLKQLRQEMVLLDEYLPHLAGQKIFVVWAEMVKRPGFPSRYDSGGEQTTSASLLISNKLNIQVGHSQGK